MALLPIDGGFQLSRIGLMSLMGILMAAADNGRSGAWDGSEAKLEMVDYYELLGVSDCYLTVGDRRQGFGGVEVYCTLRGGVGQVPIAASRKEVKQAYYNLAKECHPDYLGEPGHNACILLNEAYEVLTDPEQRNWYDFRLDRAKQEMGDGYTGERPLHRFKRRPPTRAVKSGEVE